MLPSQHTEEKEIEDLLRKIKARDAQIERLLKSNHDMEVHINNLNAVIGNITNSRSWKITQGFRSAMRVFRAMFPLYKFKHTPLELLSSKNTSVVADKCTVNGVSPSFKVVAKNNNKNPSFTGWCKLNLHIKAEKYPNIFLLYYSVDNNFDPHNRFWITVEGGEPNSFLINLPSGTKSLRLDPFESKSSFTIKDISLTEIGKLQVLNDIFKKQIFLNPKRILNRGRKAISLLRSGGLTALKAALFKEGFNPDYSEWVSKYDTISESQREKIKVHIESLSYKPKISIVMPTYNTPIKYLRLALNSVIKQLYTNWELCIADDASTDVEIKDLLKEYAKKDSRIKVVFRENNGHISKASNSALEIITGEYVSFLDHDDEITEHALYYVVNEINQYPETKLIYSDEDKKLEDGARFNPYFKPDWNPALLLSQNYVCHFLTLQSSLVKEIGGFRESVNGAQDWDLILRASQNIDESAIRHIPRILYHWRVIEGSTARSTDYKPYVLEAQKKAVKDHLSKVASKEVTSEVVVRKEISQLSVIFRVTENPLVSIIIPTKDQVVYLKRTIDTILHKTTYQNFEILIADNNSLEDETFKYFETILHNKKVRVIKHPLPFNFSRINNHLVKEAKGNVLGFLNNDLEVISESWLDDMLGWLFSSQDIGGVGAKLYYPNNLIQHAGIVLGIGGVAGHSHKGRHRSDVGYFNKCVLTQNFSAVTAACMLVRRKVFEEINGFDEENLAVAFNDVDLNLKIREKGYKIIFCAEAELYHYESVSRGYENTPEKFARFEKEVEFMKSKWEDKLKNDPYYNPNLTLLTEDFALAFPPRVERIQN